MRLVQDRLAVKPQQVGGPVQRLHSLDMRLGQTRLDIGQPGIVGRKRRRQIQDRA